MPACFEAVESCTLTLSVLQLTSLYINAMQAIYAVSPNTLFLIEGAGQTSYSGEARLPDDLCYRIAFGP